MERQPVEVTIPSLRLGGSHTAPEPGAGAVVFAHGSGSSRRSPRNRFVAEGCVMPGWARCCSTCSGRRRPRTGARSSTSRCSPGDCWAPPTGWPRPPARAGPCRSATSAPRTGAAAALVAAAARPGRGARRRLARRPARPRGAAGAATRARADAAGRRRSRHGGARRSTARPRPSSPAARTACPWCEGAGHLFEEPGALEAVVRLAADWFGARLADARVDAGAA